MGSSYVRRHGLVGPVILVGLGVVLLLENLGMISGSIWGVLLQMWPLILIAIGIDLLIGRRSTLGAVLSLILILAVFAGGFWLAGVRIQGGGQMLPSQDVRQALGGAKSAEVLLSPAAGQLDLSAAPGSPDLIHGRVPAEPGASVRVNASTSGTVARVELRDTGGVAFPFIVSSNRAPWSLAIIDQVPVDLQVTMGAGQVTLDLSSLQLTHLQVDMAVGQTMVKLPASGRFSGKVSSAIGQLVIQVPAGMGLRLHVSSGIATASIPPTYRHDGDEYTSPSFGTSQNTVDLDVSQAIGSIEVR